MEEASTQPREFFCQTDLEQLKSLADLYIQAKGLILYSEEVDPDSRSNLQVIKELRDSHDHVMRVVALRLSRPEQYPEAVTVAPEDYCRKNLEKAIGHVFRAAFDALDGTIVSLRKKVTDILCSYPTDVIREVIPEYWDIKISLEKLTQTIASHRQKKDVGADITKSLDDYVADVENIKTFYSKLLVAGTALDECKSRKHSEEQRERKNHRNDHIFSGVSYSIIIGIGAFLLGGIATYFGLSKKQEPLATITSPHSMIEAPAKGAQKPLPPAPVEKTEKNKIEHKEAS